MKTSILLTLILFIPALATAAPIFPPLIDGTAQVRINSATVELDSSGVPLSVPTGSVGLYTDTDPTGIVLLCKAMGAGETHLVTFTVENNSIGRVAVAGFAYASADCSGVPSDPSENMAYYFFMPPARPVLAL